MKLAIYLTKTKIWYSGKSVDWASNDLINIFTEIRKDERVRDVRIVLGNDISFVGSFKAEESYSREQNEELARGLMPFSLDKNCFDYRIVAGVGGEKWVQVIAIEKWLLDAVSNAVRDSGLLMELMIPIGVLLGEKTTGREAPTLIKWDGMEKLSVLATNGLTDSIYTDETDEQINEYARAKWGLAVDMEQVILDSKSFEISQEAFKEKNRGDDAVVLNIPILKKEDITTEEPVVGGEIKVVPVEEKKQTVSTTTIVLVVVLILSIILMVVVLYLNSKQSATKIVAPVKTAITIAPTASPTAAIQEKMDLSIYKVQVLNGSGVTGEAGRVKDLLTGKGFASVDVGNAPPQTETSIDQKSSFPSDALTAAEDNIKEYKIGNIGLLTSDSKYDLVIVLGSSKNQ